MNIKLIPELGGVTSRRILLPKEESNYNALLHVNKA
jgi:hypothetical protein